MSDEFVDPSRESFDAFKALRRDEPVEMLNLLRFRDRAVYPPNHFCAAEQLSGAEAYRRYSAESASVFTAVGGSIVWSAKPELVLIGPGDEHWDLAFVARYPTASAFLAMVKDDEYQRAVVHRQAAVSTSRLIRTSPRDHSGSAFA